MAEIDYPSELPGPLIGTFKDGRRDPWVSDLAEVGAARRRARFTRALGVWSYTLRLNGEQKLLLESFYDDDLSYGVEPFNWVHPSSGQVYEVRFSGRPDPSHHVLDIWDADIEIEEI